MHRTGLEEDQHVPVFSLNGEMTGDSFFFCFGHLFLIFLYYTCISYGIGKSKVIKRGAEEREFSFLLKRGLSAYGEAVCVPRARILAITSLPCIRSTACNVGGQALL